MRDRLCRYRRLTKHFLRGFVENDALAPDGGLHSMLAPLLAAVAAPGVALPAIWTFSYGWPFANAAEFQALALRHELLLVSLPMVVVGLVTVLNWNALYPDARDRAVLGLLPVSLRAIFCAKISALILFVGAFALAVNGPAALCYPVVANMRPQPGSTGIAATLLGHLAATFGASAFAAVLVLGGFGLVQAMVPRRLFRAASSLGQLVSVILLVFALLMLPVLVAAIDPEQQGRAAELVSLHRLYSVEGEGTFDWLHPPAWSKWMADTEHRGMRLKSESDPAPFARTRTAVPDGRLKTALAQPAPGGGGDGVPWVLWCPPVWFVGVYEVVAGRGGATPALLANRALVALGLCGLLATACYLLAYARQVAGTPVTIAAGDRARRAPGRVVIRSVLRLLVPDRVARAAFAFTAKTSIRAAKPRLILAAAVGLALALSLADLAVRGGSIVREGSASPLPDAGVLGLQPLLVSLLIIGARIAFPVPSSLAANWVFRFNGPEALGSYAVGARRALVWCGIVPMLLLLTPLHVLLFGWRFSAIHETLGLLEGLILVEVLFITFRQIPYAAAYVPGRARLRSRLLPYVLGFEACFYAVIRLEEWALASATSLGWTTGGLTAIYVTLVVLRRCRNGGVVVYDDASPDAIQTLDLAGPLLPGWTDGR